MTTFRFKTALCAAVLAASANALEVPSNLVLTLHEVLFEDNTARFRYVAPDVARDLRLVSYADIEADFLHLCANFALPALKNADKQVDEIVISIADRVTEFGQATPDATQFFEAFEVKNATCIWKEF